MTPRVTVRSPLALESFLGNLRAMEGTPEWQLYDALCKTRVEDLPAEAPVIQAMMRANIAYREYVIREFQSFTKEHS